MQVNENLLAKALIQQAEAYRAEEDAFMAAVPDDIARLAGKVAQRIARDKFPNSHGRRAEASRKVRAVTELQPHDHAGLNAAGFTHGFALGGTQYVLRNGQRYTVARALEIANRLAQRSADAK